MKLDGKNVAILIAPRGTEDPEFAKPKAAVEDAGATVTVIGLEAGEAETNNNDLDPGSRYQVDKSIDEASADDFDALIIPGGCVGADKLPLSRQQAPEPGLSPPSTLAERINEVGLLPGPLFVDADSHYVTVLPARAGPPGWASLARSGHKER